MKTENQSEFLMDDEIKLIEDCEHDNEHDDFDEDIY